MSDIVILGGGGHARVVFDALQNSDYRVVGYTSKEDSCSKKLPIPFLGNDKNLQVNMGVKLALGIGSSWDNSIREKIFNSFKAIGFSFTQVVHPNTIIANNVSFKEGVQVMAGAIIQPFCKVGNNVLINTGVSLDHDCEILDHVHIAPGAVLSGTVCIEAGAFVGLGAKIIKGAVIGEGARIAAGAIVTKDVPEKTIVKGVW